MKKLNLYDMEFIDYLVQIVDDRMQELPIRRRAEWLQTLAVCLQENLKIDIIMEMKIRGFP